MAKRRANGEGSLFQRETGRHAGKWVARVTVPGPDGRPKNLDKLFKTQAEAKKHVRDQINLIAQGRTPAPKSMPLKTYLDTWLETRAKPRLSRNTYDRYKSAVKTHIQADAIATVPIASLTHLTIAAMLDRRRAQGAKPPTLRNIRAVLSIALRDALTEGLIHDNPATRLPSIKGQRSEIRCLDPDQCKALLDAAANHEIRPLLIVALRTGMRISELLGLTWDCVNFKTRKCTVKHQLQRHDGKFYLADTKTAGARRTFTVSRAVIEQLQILKERDNSATIPGDTLSNLIFKGRNGAPYHRKTILDWTNQLMKTAGLPEFGFHALRHTCASILINDGADPLRVQKHLGHSNVTVTMGTYAHLFDDRLEENHDILDRALD